MGGRLLAAGLGGIGVACAFPPVACAPAAFAGVALLLRASNGAGWKARFLLGWVAGVAGYTLAVTWLWTALARFTGKSASVVAIGVVLLIGYQALQLALFAVLAAERDGEGVLSRCALVAALWVVIEWSFPKLVPWTLADGLAGALLFRQAADLAGAYGLSFAIAAAAAAIARCSSVSLVAADRARPLATAIGIVVVLAAYGAVRVVQYHGHSSSSRLHVTLVQGGLGLQEDPREQNDLAWRIYEPLTHAALAQTRVPKPGALGALVVWPEGTLRAYLRSDAAQLGRMRRFLSRIHRPLLLGALDRRTPEDGELNAAYLVTATVSRAPQLQVYHKVRLVPFGEYVPDIGWLAAVRDWRTTGDFVSGTRGGPLELANGVRLAPAICFEVLQPGVFNQMVRAGARLLVNLSDDGWFAGTAEPQQHLALSAMRAVETRRWLARASDSGVSAVIDPLGRIVAKLEADVIGAIRLEVELEDEVSTYVAFGNWIVPVCFGLLAGRLLTDVARRCRSVRI